MPKTTTELILENARLVIASYPTQGVTLKDLIEITLELCADDDRKPAERTVKSAIKRAGFLKIKGKYYPSIPTQRKPEQDHDVSPLPVTEIRHDKTDWRLRVYGGVRGSAA